MRNDERGTEGSECIQKGGKSLYTKWKGEEVKKRQDASNDNEDDGEPGNGKLSTCGQLKNSSNASNSTQTIEDDRIKKSNKNPLKQSRQLRRQLDEGTIINTHINRYRVLGLVGSGGFGDVYSIECLKRTAEEMSTIFAMKTEVNSVDGSSRDRLKIETTILELCAALQPQRRQHFIRMIDKGRTEEFKFVVTDLVGLSLDHIQLGMPGNHFSYSTCTNLGLQTIDAIADLHDLGYIHRDVKPQNFAVGVGKMADTIFLVDFGIVRKYTIDGCNLVRMPRAGVRFLGTVRYASRNCHRSRDQCRRDDLESWLYMLLEFIDHGALPWAKKINKNVVCTLKEKFFAGNFPKTVTTLPEEISKIIRYIDSLKYPSSPDYHYMKGLLCEAARKRKANLDEQFDWQMDTSSESLNSEIISERKESKEHSGFYSRTLPNPYIAHTRKRLAIECEVMKYRGRKSTLSTKSTCCSRSTLCSKSTGGSKKRHHSKCSNAKKHSKLSKRDEELKEHLSQRSDNEEDKQASDKEKVKHADEAAKQKRKKKKHSRHSDEIDGGLKKKSKAHLHEQQQNICNIRSKLPLKTVINTEKNRYEVVKLLGSGGFGDVYQVRRLSNENEAIKEQEKKDGMKEGNMEQQITKQQGERNEAKKEKRKNVEGKKEELFALKTENYEDDDHKKGHNRLKVEMGIFQICATLPKEKRLHFVEMVDKGRTEQFKFIVMQLVGRSLDRIQKDMEERRFSLRTSIKLAIQTVESIGDLHEIGYIHRDIKPQNFTLGLDDYAETVFILDFGIARNYTVKGSKVIRLPREKVGFLGTLRYASRNCHMLKEQCRRDDLESWIYMFLEFTDYKTALTWSGMRDKEKVFIEKGRLFAGKYTQTVSALPEEIHKIIQYVDSLDYPSTPDYVFVRTMLRKAAERRNITLEGKFDWHYRDTHIPEIKRASDHEKESGLDDLAWIL